MSGRLLGRVFAWLLLSAPIRRRLGNTIMRRLLASLAWETGRLELVAELSPPAEPMPAPAVAIAGLFREALRQAEQGKTIGAAGRTLEKALKKAPDDIACLALAVMIFTLLGKRAAAESFGRRAIELAPRVPALHLNLGNCLRDQQRYEEALACYRVALDLDPVAIQIRLNLAQCLAQLNRMEEARAGYCAVVATPGDMVPAEICRATALAALDRLVEAEAALNHIVERSPSHKLALAELASIYRRTKRHGAAEAILARLLKADADGWRIHHDLAGLYYETHRYAEAEAAGRRAWSLNPNDPSVLANLARILSVTGDLTEAESFARRAMKLRHGRGADVLGLILERQCRFAEAGEMFERQIAAEPDSGGAHLSLALHLLRQGNYRRGLAEFEWRWRWEQTSEIYRQTSCPQWTAAVRRGTSVLVWAEQGLGDSIQMLRFIPMLIERGYRPILELQKPLHSLARHNLSCPVHEPGEEIEATDSHIPLLSLPYALGIALPSPASYLAAEPGHAAKWRERLQPDGRRLLVGLNWAGNPHHGNDGHRSIPLALFEKILAVEGVRFISLQKDLRTGDASLLEQLGDRIETRHIEDSADFGDMAAMISHLDLVIAIDSAVIHLVGALGKPGWLLLPFCPDWRWLTGRDDSVWYRSLRLFRQPQARDWESPLNHVAEALKDHILTTNV